MKPFDHNKFLGYVAEITPVYVKMQHPSSHLLHSFYYEGQVFEGGIVGSFVVIEGQDYGFLGRIVEVGLPQGEKIEITENKLQEQNTVFHPISKIEILGVFNVYEPGKIEKTVTCYPQIGAKVYACSDEQIGAYIKKFGFKKGKQDGPYASIGYLTSNNAICNISLNSLFGRHCAVVGTTGSGKSWTVASLLESIEKQTTNKCILIDATGEYGNISENMTTVVMGDGQCVFPYQKLTIDELYFLLHPSAKTQVPKLMEAIRSLKIAKLGVNEPQIKGMINGNGNLIKANNIKRPFEKFYFEHVEKIEDKECDFDMLRLPHQITNECIWDTNRNDINKWGDRNENDVSNCISLISRINNIINTGEYNKIFGFKKDSNSTVYSITDTIDELLVSNKQVLRIDFSNVSFDYQVREILVDAIGKYLLEKARRGEFKNNPLIVFVDEAHQFLNKSIADEYFAAKPLDAFEQISKEARKYGLFLCIATQMPKDIPIGTLSQMGSFLVHRLINEQDKKAVESAVSSANRNVLSFLPILGEGEAILVGVDFPMPLTIKIAPPTKGPDSETPRLSAKDNSLDTAS